MRTEIVIVGAGGHGRVVMDALIAGDESVTAAFADDDPALHGGSIFGRRVGPVADLCTSIDFHFHVAIGRNAVRAETTAQLLGRGGRAVTIVHPAAVVAPSSELGPGCFVAAQAVVAPGASVGGGSIVNHGAVVDHDCVVGAFSHVAPNATLAGAVVLGRGVLVGAGANVLPGVKIGDGAVIGAGAVVDGDVVPGAVVAGVPARRLGGKSS
ncbi:MAG: acetyltransferase [Caldimonas sp.]